VLDQGELAGPEGTPQVDRESSRSLDVRLAILGTPRTGNTWVRRVLSDSLFAQEVAVYSPSEINWKRLQERFVIQLHWPRTDELIHTLTNEGVRVISIARHPLDVLISVLEFAQKEPSTNKWIAGDGGDESGLLGSTIHDADFVAWCAGERAMRLLQITPGWWDDPTTIRVRYEDLESDPEKHFDLLLREIGRDPQRDLGEVISENDPARLDRLSGGVHVSQARSGRWRELFDQEAIDHLCDVYEPLMTRLGYRSGSCAGRPTP
jgi:Sulfotransferase domain